MRPWTLAFLLLAGCPDGGEDLTCGPGTHKANGMCVADADDDDTAGDSASDSGDDSGGDSGADSGTDDSGEDSGQDSGEDSGTDSGADSGEDSGTDSGGDSGSDSGGDDAFCDETLDSSAPGGPDCVTAEIACGDTIEATTQGGSDEVNGDAYLAWYCAPSPDDYEGTERAYELSFTERTQVTFDLEAPCEDVDLFVVAWGDDSCPTAANSVLECENGDSSGDDSIVVDAFEGDRYVVFVETPDEVDTNFRLTVTCATR